MKLKLNMSRVDQQYRNALTPMGYSIEEEYCGGVLISGQVIISILVAAVLWFGIFGMQVFNFWVSIGVSVCILTGLALVWGGWAVEKKHVDLRALILGIGSAVVLYGVFYLGNKISSWLFPFAPGQITSIYDLSEQGSPIFIILLLLFVTSPGEEIFWRGYVQRWTMKKFGQWGGLIVGALIYAGVHIVSGNFILVMAALICGIFWGWMYMYEKNIAACIISHSLWTALVFIIFPITPGL